MPPRTLWNGPSAAGLRPTLVWGATRPVHYRGPETAAARVPHRELVSPSSISIGKAQLVVAHRRMVLRSCEIDSCQVVDASSNEPTLAGRGLTHSSSSAIGCSLPRLKCHYDEAFDY